MAKSRPGLSPEAEENRMIALAVNLAEKQLTEGTASSQIITHYLKLATVKEKLQNERLMEENKLLRAKTEHIQREEKLEEKYDAAIKAMKAYQGYGDPDDYN
jgi:hypothetical protein